MRCVWSIFMIIWKSSTQPWRNSRHLNRGQLWTRRDTVIQMKNLSAVRFYWWVMFAPFILPTMVVKHSGKAILSCIGGNSFPYVLLMYASLQFRLANCRLNRYHGLSADFKWPLTVRVSPIDRSTWPLTLNWGSFVLIDMRKSAPGLWLSLLLVKVVCSGC
jgi:hypothetical protein